jgi:hypothetical protein
MQPKTNILTQNQRDILEKFRIKNLQYEIFKKEDP